MFNTPALLMRAKKKEPQACFSLRTPWLYCDADYCGNPRNEPGHENGSGAPGPCGGCFFLDLLDEGGNTIATLKNKDRYDTDPYEMFYGTWGEFYESAKVFNEPLALTGLSDSNTPIRAIKFNLWFMDMDYETTLSREISETADRTGSLTMTIETSSASYQIASNTAVDCCMSAYGNPYFPDGVNDGYDLGGLMIRNQYKAAAGFTASIPETLTLRYGDIRRINIAVTAGLVMWLYPPPTQDIV